MALYNLTYGHTYTFTSKNNTAKVKTSTDNATEIRDFAHGLRISSSNIVADGTDCYLQIGQTLPGTTNYYPMVSINNTNDTVASNTNTMKDFQLVISNNTLTDDAFCGIAFINGTDLGDFDSIGAAIRAQRNDTSTTTVNTNLTFATNDDESDDLTERYRITHDGRHCWGSRQVLPDVDQTSCEFHFKSNKNNDSGDIMYIENSSTDASCDGVRIVMSEKSDPTTSNYFMRFADTDTATLGGIKGDGAGDLVFDATSDRRLKTNIKDYNITLDDIDEIRVRKFLWKKNMTNETLGVIAQELLETKFAQFVSTHDNRNESSGAKEGDKDYEYMTVGYTKFIPVLIKGIQESNKMIKKLQQEIDELREKLNGVC